MGNRTVSLLNHYKLTHLISLYLADFLNLIQSNIIDKGLEIKAVISDSRDVFLIPDELYNSSKREEFYKLNYSNIPAGKIIKEQSISLLNATSFIHVKNGFMIFLNITSRKLHF